MADVVKDVLAHEVDTNVLFEKFTIEEIRDIEKKTRTEIERKKEDLRQMVGERYRELIEAADTITQMRNCALKVKESIGSIEEDCQKLKRSHMVHGITIHQGPRDDPSRRKGESHFYSIAAQIKLLLDIPEKIWSAIDATDYLLATRLFLLARHVNTSLQIDSPQSSRIGSWFPVIARQWSAISHFRGTILQGCRERLKSSSSSDQVTAECLVSIMLLEDSTPRQVFNEFLLARTTAVQELFQPEHAGGSVKSQVCDVVLSVLTTVHQIYAIFYLEADSKSEASNNLLMSILEQVTSKDRQGSILTDSDTTGAMKCLPPGVTGFRPLLKSAAGQIANDKLTENCKQWIRTCIQDVQVGVAKLLGYVNSVKGIAAIRTALWQLLKEDERMGAWDVVCEKIVGQKLSIWEQFLRSHFLDRVKVLLQGHLEAALSGTKQQVAKVLTELANIVERSVETDLAAYTWTESPTDIPANTAWVPIGNKNISEGGTLLMKTKSYTPAVQGLSQSFDGKLTVFLDDGNCYLNQPGGSTESVGLFDQNADNQSVETYIQQQCEAMVNSLVTHLTQQLYACQQQLQNSTDPHGCGIIINRVLLLGRFASAVPELCSHLQKCIVTNKDKQESTRLTKKSLLRNLSKSEDPNWAAVKQSLQNCSQEAYRIWVEHVCVAALRQFEEAVTDTSGHAIMMALTSWEELEIAEETEDGRTVKSTIRVPMQSCWPVQRLLYCVCDEINRIGGHALCRSVLQDMINMLSSGVLKVYKKLLSDAKVKDKAGVKVTMTQARALQLMFDIKFLSHILALREDTESTKKHNKEIDRLIDTLEGYVDPFDLDVFSPFIKSTLLKHTQRCMALFGSLATVNKHGSVSLARTSHSGQHEQHNVLPLASTQARFPLLPLSIQKSTTSLSISAPKPKMTQPISSGPGSPPPVIPVPENQPSSFLGTMSNMWFSNVGK